MKQGKLLTLYKKAVDSKQIKQDDKQWIALEALQETFDQLQKPMTKKWFNFSGNEVIKGVYLYGAVGTGKTYLMDLFYQELTLKKKMRMHFHRFMKMVHEKLNLLEGKSDPLKILAKEIAGDIRVICFDEFFVENIVDAMLLGGLFEALYALNTTIIMTSNIEPDELYKDGLQRERFVPAIELIKKNSRIVQVDNDIDYRLGMFDYDRAYYYPEDPEMKDMLLSRFKAQSKSPVQFQKTIKIEDRKIQTMYLSDKSVWFDFPVICGIPRSQLDYIALAEIYATVFMSDLREIKKPENDLITNFIRLIDVFYDAHIKLIISSKVPIDHIYPEGKFAFEFERSKSRLIEMQSKEYLSLKA